MNPFTRFAYFTVARDASFVALASGMLMLSFSFWPTMAFEVGAVVALVFSLGLLIRANFLTEERFVRSEAWRALRDEEKPDGEEAQHWARAELQEVLLRFAKSAAGVACVLFASALVLSAA
jgi:hypothetical protein